MKPVGQGEVYRCCGKPCMTARPLVVDVKTARPLVVDVMCVLMLPTADVYRRDVITDNLVPNGHHTV